MKLEGTRFGEIKYTKADLVNLPDGMIGFGGLTSFVVVNTKENSPFRWLQSVEEPPLAFLVAFPDQIIGDYTPEIPISIASELSLTDESPYLVLVTATIPKGKPMDAVANLAAPILINLETRIGKQVILEDEAYTMRYPIFASKTTAAAA
jgi:flagellar assembly factor FliW